MPKLSHLDESGRAKMVDVSGKQITTREAEAESILQLNQATYQLIHSGTAEKGDVLAVARIAGIQAAKKTSELIPLCHPLALTNVSVDFDFIADNRLLIKSRARVSGQTGVEMEALTAVSVAALTVYDMCKAAQKDIVIESTRLISKTGGKSGSWQAP